MRTTARIKKFVEAALPKGKPFRVVWEPTGIGQWRILRVVTPAWKSLPRFERIHKLQQAVEPNLTAWSKCCASGQARYPAGAAAMAVTKPVRDNEAHHS